MDVVRDVRGEALDLVDDRRPDNQPDQEDREEEAEEDDEDRGGARQLQPADPIDGGAERDREEHRDQQQPEDGPHEVEHVKQDAQRDEREEDPRDRAGAELVLSDHGPRQAIRAPRRGKRRPPFRWPRRRGQGRGSRPPIAAMPPPSTKPATAAPIRTFFWLARSWERQSVTTPTSARSFSTAIPSSARFASIERRISSGERAAGISAAPPEPRSP